MGEFSTPWSGVFIFFRSMFTGIITETGTLESRTRSRVAIRASRGFVRALTIGTSVSVSGVCLTVVEKGRGFFLADIMPETVRRTTLGTLRKGDHSNLELPATPASFLSGHIVQGHVDGVGVVKKITREGNSHILSIEVIPSIARQIAEKGSIAVDGISLTVISTRRSGFTVGIIPHTKKMTTLRSVKKGDTVNIEIERATDYARRSMNPVRNSPPRRPFGRASAGAISNGVKKTSNMKHIKDIRIGIISSSFREEVARALEQHCVATLKRKKLSDAQIRIVRVPGALEIPLVAKRMAKNGEYDALITFGAIVKGKTYHFEQIANECARGCMDVSLTYDIPVIFEVLAVYSLADALERATRKEENKGVEAAETALAMIDILSKV